MVLLAFLAIAGCRSGGSDPATQQENFGVRMAKINLWREAMFRFQRAVEMNPDDAMAHNNLAVALEANGDFEAAAKSYREAMRLDRSNEFIQKNYSRFIEFTTRDKRRQQRRPASQTAATATAEEAKPVTEPEETEEETPPQPAPPGGQP
jgi:Tfp pilus assembly protein PilF